MITNSTFSNNTGHPQMNMFYIVLNSLSSFSYIYSLKMDTRYRSLLSEIKFSDCIFTRNINMEAIIYIRPPTTYLCDDHSIHRLKSVEVQSIKT